MITQVAPFALSGLASELPDPSSIPSGYQFYSIDTKTLFILKIDTATRIHSWEAMSAGPVAKIHLEFTASFPLIGPPIVYSYSVINQSGIASNGPIVVTSQYVSVPLTLSVPLAHVNRCPISSIHIDVPGIPPGEILDPFIPVSIDIGEDGPGLQVGVIINGKSSPPGSPDVGIGVSFAMFSFP